MLLFSWVQLLAAYMLVSEHYGTSLMKTAGLPTCWQIDARITWYVECVGVPMWAYRLTMGGRGHWHWDSDVYVKGTGVFAVWAGGRHPKAVLRQLNEERYECLLRLCSPRAQILPPSVAAIEELWSGHVKTCLCLQHPQMLNLLQFLPFLSFIASHLLFPLRYLPCFLRFFLLSVFLLPLGSPPLIALPNWLIPPPHRLD